MASQSSSWRKRYLSTYNVIQAGLWTALLALTLLRLPNGPVSIYAHLEPLARWTQTFALLDVLHAAAGLIPSGTATTFTQVVTRFIQVWGICWAFPEAIIGNNSSSAKVEYGWDGASSGGIAFVALLLAWSVADALRYTYLLCKLHGVEDRRFTWMRYSMFYVLYPIGIGAEWWLMYSSVEPASRVAAWLRPIFYFLLALYVPGAKFMFSHMIRQRTKVLRAKENKKL